jgi:hypothetical protein
MAHHRSFTACKRSRTRSGRKRWRGRANEIDTSVEGSPAPAFQLAGDHSPTDTELEQLGAADHVVLAPGNAPDSFLFEGHFTSIRPLQPK